MKKIILMLIFIFCTSGCSGITKITMPDQTVYMIDLRNNALVRIKNAEIEIIVNNQGKTCFLEAFVSTAAVSMPRISYGVADTTIDR